MSSRSGRVPRYETDIADALGHVAVLTAVRYCADVARPLRGVICVTDDVGGPCDVHNAGGVWDVRRGRLSVRGRNNGISALNVSECEFVRCAK